MATERTTAEGAWDHVWEGLEDTAPLGGLKSYEFGASWLADCSLIADWGCGAGAFRSFVDPDRYYGIDGSHSPFADEVVDLAEYHSETPGLFMRHVLEHDWRWAQILDNALASFTERFCLVLFSPLQDETREVGREAAAHVPVIGFRLEDVTDRFDCGFVTHHLPAEKGPGWDAVFDETVILAER